MRATMSPVRSALTVMVLTAMLLLAGALSAWAVDVAVTADGMSPDEVTIAAGDSVTFVNEGDEPVRLLEESGRWDSGLLEPGDTFSLSFEEPGEVDYASEDGALTGTIVVEADPSEGPSEDPTEDPTAEPTTEPTEDPTEDASEDEDPPAMAATGIPAGLLAGLAAAGVAGGAALLHRR